MHRPDSLTTLTVAAALVLTAPVILALEPPTAEQLERYRLDGTLAARSAAAREIGNHRTVPQLASRVHTGAAIKALPDAPTVLPAAGSPRVLTLLIAFADMPGSTDPAVVDGMLYGDGNPALFPYESLASFYRRASYGALEITGSTLGWYTTAYPRANVVESTAGRQALIREALTHYDNEGHDFAQYDNDGDGVVDYLVVVWTGAHGEWAEFWWGYQTRFYDPDFVLDGVILGTYSWQWENYDWPGPFSPEVVIHETGHALGLPDYYDYDDAIGPRGGVGGLDQMAGNWGDHNAFSKWLLGWLEPEVYNQGGHQLLLAPSDATAQAAVLMHGDPVADPYAEYFIVQHRRPQGNDFEVPADGLLIWHVDARLDDDGRFLYDNSYTQHKLLRLMEADGLEEIELGGRADADDFYTMGDVFDTVSTPSSHRYDGVPTNLAIAGITGSGDDISLAADLGSGCAIWCDAAVGTTAWPGLPVAFTGSLETANCQGTPALSWVFGDGGSSTATSTAHTYVGTGSYTWSVTTEIGDARCTHSGSMLVCTDFPCWQWNAVRPMARPRAFHAAVELADGRILVVGGSTSETEIYDPDTDSWTAAAPTSRPFGQVSAVRLDDGRVLAVAASEVGEPNSEIYDPASDTWSATGQLNHPRSAHSAVRLGDGRVLVVGGRLRQGQDYVDVHEVEVYDQDTGGWTVVGSLDRQLFYPGLAMLSDGRVLIVGGRSMTFFDPVSDELARAAPLPDEWTAPLAVTLDDGRVLLAGISSSTRTLIWDPDNGRWELVGDLSTIRARSSATRLGSGLVLVAGGASASRTELRTTEFFDPATRSWSQGSSLVGGRAYHTATLTGDGRLLLIGGVADDANSATGYTDTTEVLTRPTTPPRRPDGRASP